MTQQDRIRILIASIKANMHLESVQEEILYKSLLEGQLKIAQLESAYKKAAESFHYFQVEHVKEGFAFWNLGGYDVNRNRGRAMMAAGYDLTELKVLRTMREKNGRHTQCLLYQGCFLCEYEIAADKLETYRVYQVVSLIGREGKCEAKCQRLLTSSGRYYDSCLAAEEEARFGKLISATYAMAAREDNISTEYRVS